MAPYIISISALKQESHLYPAEVDYALQQLKKEEEEVEKTTKSSTKKRKAESELVREDKGERICLFNRTLRFDIEGINGAEVLEDLLIMHNGYIELPTYLEITKKENDIINVKFMVFENAIACRVLLYISCISEELMAIMPELNAAGVIVNGRRRYKTGMFSAKDFGLELLLKLGADINRPFSAELHLNIDIQAQDLWSLNSLAVSDTWEEEIGAALPNGKPESVKRWRSRKQYTPTVTVHDFYDAVTLPTVQYVPSAIQPAGMTCQLLPFQTRSVRWMLQREGFDVRDDSDDIVPFHRSEPPPTFFKNTDCEGKTCYVSHVLGVVSTNLDALRADFALYKGGILAEEMGLGKTVELIALICLNKRRDVGDEPIWDDYTNAPVKPSLATLIITPYNILYQWQKEIARHAPHLKVHHYIGISRSKDKVPTVEQLLEYDIVLTTYDVLSKEVHFAVPPPDRKMRRRKGGRENKPRRSPLVGISWWRVCIDEAQMIESGISGAANVARLIPRINAWCVTGTPVGNQITDLLGLLTFLRYEPIWSNPKVWKRLLAFYPESFKAIFHTFSLRHSKKDVRDEIYLPPQKRFVITVPFSHIEEENYKFIFEQMIQECEITTEGCAALDADSPAWKKRSILSKMRFWLVRLRQVCSHAQVGRTKKKGGDMELRTVDEVLEQMIEQHLSQLRSDERALFSMILKRGQVLEYFGELDEALKAYLDGNRQLQEVVLEARQRVKEEEEGEEEEERESTLPPNEVGSISNGNVNNTKNGNDRGKGKAKGGENEEEGEAEEEEGRLLEEGDDDEYEEEWYDDGVRLKNAKRSLRDILEIEHTSLFFLGSIYYQLKTREEKANPNEAAEYAAKEAEYYDAAKQIRKEILTTIEKRAQGFIQQCRRKTQNQSFTEVPEMVFDEIRGGIETQTISEELTSLQDQLNTQANHIDEWREKLIQLLISPLVDQDDNATGEEFEQSVNKQTEGFAYMEALRTVIADRQYAMTGQSNILAEEDLQRALARNEPHTAVLRNLILERNSFKPQVNQPMRALLTRLRSIIFTLKVEGNAGNHRAEMEKKLAESMFRKAEKAYNEQAKANIMLEREMNLYRNTINARVAFYRQLQSLSDTVTPFDPEKENGVTLASTVAWKRQEEAVAAKVADARAKERFLTHLKTANDEEEGRTCIICQSSFDLGTFTVCGHQYCAECMAAWYKQHRSCPMCKRRLKDVDMYRISYNPQLLAIQEERSTTSSAVTVHKTSDTVHAIYSDLHDTMLKSIKQRKLNRSFGSKIDMICKHLLWLNENEPEAKSVIFSQWSDVLYVFEQAFKANEINYATMDKNGVARFKSDPDVKCFLLHAKSQSAGLTLVNATNVFLCEPLLNTGLELQAISRVHRIGQTKPNNVWLYVVSGTVEQSVLNLTTKRRLALAGVESDEVDAIPDFEIKLDEGNSEEMKRGKVMIEKGTGGGEVVVDEDLLECLIGSARDKLSSKEAADEVRRQLMAEAAEQRIATANGSAAHGTLVLGEAGPAHRRT